MCRFCLANRSKGAGTPQSPSATAPLSGEPRGVRIFPALILNNFRFSMLAFLPISLYNGKRGFIRGAFLKYLFYFIYPLHIFIIYLIKLNLGYFT